MGVLDLTGSRPSRIPSGLVEDLMALIAEHEFCFDPGQDLLLLLDTSGSVVSWV